MTDFLRLDILTNSYESTRQHSSQENKKCNYDYEENVFVKIKDLEFIDLQNGGDLRDSEKILNSLNNTQRRLKVKDEEEYYTFTDNNKKNKDELEYLTNGAYSVLFEIQNEQGKVFILKCFYDNECNLLNSYNKYKELELTGTHMMNIYMMGNIYDDNYIQCQYLITDKYNNETDIKNFSFEDKFDLFIQIYNFINDCIENEILYRDVKLKNIGCDENNNFIILDFDDKTLLEYKEA